MKNKKRWLCGAMGVMLMLTAAGCAQKQATNTKTESGDGEMPTTLTIYGGLGGHAVTAGAKTANDTLPFQLMEEMTGVHVEWQHPSGSADEAFNLMIASGSLPDMIVTNWPQVSGGVQTYVDDEIIIPLQDLIEENMPYLTAFNEERPDVKKEYTMDDGSVYYIPFVRADKELKVYMGPQIRKDWLDKLGLEVPKTTDELYEVLKAFKTQDPNGNGEADEIPMTGCGFDEEGMGIGDLLWAFGAHYDFYLKDGKVVYGIMEDEFEDGISYIAKLYSEGLIDVDFLLNDRTKMDSKMMNDQAGFVFSYQPTLYYNNMNDGTRKVEGIPYLSSEPGKTGISFMSEYAHDIPGTSIAVTTSNANPAGSLKWLDNFFGGKGLEYMNFGQEGLTFNWEDGYPKLTDYLLNNPDGKSQADMCGMNLGAYDSQFPTLQDWRYYEQILSPWGKEAIDTWANNSEISGILPTLTFSDEETSKITRIMSEVESYASEAMTKMVVGTASVDTLGEVKDRIRSMGIDEVLKIYNEAYQRFIAR